MDCKTRALFDAVLGPGFILVLKDSKSNMFTGPCQLEMQNLGH